MRKLEIREVQKILMNLMIKLDGFCRDHDIKYYIIGGTLLGAVRHKGFIPWDDDIDIAMLREDYEKFLKVRHLFSTEYDVKNFNNDDQCDYAITRVYIPNTLIDNPATRKTKIDRRLFVDIFPLDTVPGDAKLEKNQEKKILVLKKRIWYSVPYQYTANPIKKIVRKAISIFYAPFRKFMVVQLDAIMKRYCKFPNVYYCSMASQYSYQKQKMIQEIYGAPQNYTFENYQLQGPADYDSYLSQLYGPDYMQLPPIEKRRKGNDVYVIE